MPSHFNKLRKYYIIQTVSSIVSLGMATFFGYSDGCRFSIHKVAVIGEEINETFCRVRTILL